MSILENQLNHQVLNSLSNEELYELAAEIREFLIKNVSKTGGHLASNLGVVELTIALHKVFNTQADKIIWDVGHQTYVHKLLTGRMEQFATLRQMGGISGFPKREESVHDHFNTGHSSTSISAALGLARARDLNHEAHSVVAVIGDGALTGGMAFEALNDAGQTDTNLLVIINDNEMSISPNVGGLSTYLTSMRTKRNYNKLKDVTERLLTGVPFVGVHIFRFLRRIKNSVKYLLVPGAFFEMLGFHYYGVVDGHDIRRLTDILNHVKTIKGPTILHVATKKGKGYAFAEQEPDKYHGISKFDFTKGITYTKLPKITFSHAMAEQLTNLARKDSRIVAITAAMPEGTGLSAFQRQFPERFFDVGIAEQHAVTCAAGLSVGGFIPAVSIYSSFLQRAYDQLIHDIALQNLHVVLFVDRAGIVGEDGETHQGIYDLAYLATVPSLTVFAPCDFWELNQMMEYAFFQQNGPVAIRYPRGGEVSSLSHEEALPVTKAEVLLKGEDVTILAVGKMVGFALNAAQILKENGIKAEVINLRCAKPIDMNTVSSSVLKTRRLLTVEDGILTGGVGERVIRALEQRPVYVDSLGFPDEPVKQGAVAELYRQYGLDGCGIANTILKEFFHEG